MEYSFPDILLVCSIWLALHLWPDPFMGRALFYPVIWSYASYFFGY